MQVDELFAGRYRLEREIGRGGMGVVWKAYDERLHRPVAVKVMSASLVSDPAMRRRFEREASTAAQLQRCPNVVPVLDFDDDQGQFYLVLGYIDGHDLGREIGLRGRLDWAQTAQVATDVAAALDAAYQLGVVHRDVKPANVLLEPGPGGQPRALLTDFGLAKAGESLGLTSAGTVLGTVTYLSPEQLRGQPATRCSDIYALACVVYQCLSGRTPYTGANDMAVATAHLHAPVPDLREVVPDLPRRAADVVARAMSKQAEDRPASAGALARDLADALRQPERQQVTRPLAAAPAPRAEEQQVEEALHLSPPVPRRRPVLVGAAVVAGTFLTAALVGYTTGGGNGAGLTPGQVTTSAASDPVAALASRLPVSVYGACHREPDREGPGRVVAVTCASAVPGADELLVTQWQDQQVMLADFAGTYARRYPDGKCARFDPSKQPGINSSWRNNAPLACYVNSNNAAILLWEYDDQPLQVLAVRKDRNAAALFAWWREAVKTPIG